MGAAQSIPGIGEAITVVDSAGRAIAAGVTYPFDKKAAEKLIDSAGDTWKTYADRSAITANIRLAAANLCDDGEECERLKKAQAEAWTELGENTPVVGHIIGIVHYAEGDEEGGDRCMTGATRTAVVIGATVATGGAGAVAAGAATIGSGLLFDSTVTGVQSLKAHKFKPSGYIAGAARAVETGDARDIYKIVASPIEDFATGALGGLKAKAVGRASVLAADLVESEGEQTLSFVIHHAGEGVDLEAPARVQSASTTVIGPQHLGRIGTFEQILERIKKLEAITEPTILQKDLLKFLEKERKAIPDRPRWDFTELPKEIDRISDKAACHKYYRFRENVMERRLSPKDAAKEIGDSHYEKLSDGSFSIRLSQEHRLVFEVDNAKKSVTVKSLGGHY